MCIYTNISIYLSVSEPRSPPRISVSLFRRHPAESGAQQVGAGVHIYIYIYIYIYKYIYIYIYIYI